MAHLDCLPAAFVLILLCLLCACAVAADVARMPPEEFAILPWGSTPGTPEALHGIRECGFNLAGFVDAQSLDAVQKAGLKAIVFGADVRGVPESGTFRAADELAARVGKHPAAFGYYLVDEPSAGLYPALARWVEALRRADPDRLAYINLFPNYASPAQMGAPDYETYLEDYVRQVKPAFISYDHYALMNDGTLRGGYYENLESVRRVALRHGLPFWNIVLSNAHFRYAEPTPAGLRLQAYTTLAYGARGISYFTYFTPHTGNYRLGPVDQFGQRSPTWDMLRSVNMQIHCLAAHLVKVKSTGVFHHPGVPAGCSGLDSGRFVSTLGEGDYLVGEFEGADGAVWAMVVNKSLTQSYPLEIGFKQKGAVQQVDPYTGVLHPLGGEGVWLAPGQGTLLTVRP